MAGFRVKDEIKTNPDGTTKAKLRLIAFLATPLKLCESIIVDQQADHIIVPLRARLVVFRVKDGRQQNTHGMHTAHSTGLRVLIDSGMATCSEPCCDVRLTVCEMRTEGSDTEDRTEREGSRNMTSLLGFGREAR